ncbi:lipopolysaccharide biosynthesis protein [Psychromonas sp. psych-6C06]|uniref:lipopolysaccharide biosynthesis protein n=1 Tax=Psychromonas sp. psych-6C06 TaxID=2058089 RepID=UPI000C3222DC|nr:lipopolysaccharide biosynthesis protein [Psychromonas sp. psych-6C06]PKF62538.1 lipopolysaccharide biosynthesis protein [Psychromonas sp. psych-6C06]
MIEEEFQEFISSLDPKQVNNFAALSRHAKLLAEENPSLSLRILKQVNVLQSKHKVHLLNRIEKQSDELQAVAKNGEIESKDSELEYENLKKSFELRQLKNFVFLAKQVRLHSKQSPEVALLLLEDVEYLQQLQKNAIKRQLKKLAEAPKENIEAEKEKAQATRSNPNIITHEEQKTYIQKLLRSSFLIFVVLPFSVFAIYQILIATPRYESQAQVIVQQPDSMATMDANMALLAGMGVAGGNSDTELVKAYIYSTDMLIYLNETLNLRDHYSQEKIDYFSRIHASDTREELIEYYYQRISVDIHEKSGIITIYVQGFDSDYAQKLANTIVERAEWYINSIGHQLANAQLSFVQGEHAIIENRLESAQISLLNFQQQYNLLDPSAEGMAMQEIAYSLRGEISKKQAELKAMKSIMSNQAPQMLALKNELKALNNQLKTEKNKLAQTGKDKMPVSEILAKFTDYKVKMELALQSYTSSQISLEKSRIEAYRQIKYLVVVESATLSESNKYPQILYNLALFFVVNMSIFAIGKIVISVIKELK